MFYTCNTPTIPYIYYRCATIGYVPHTEMRTIFLCRFFPPLPKISNGLAVNDLTNVSTLILWEILFSIPIFVCGTKQPRLTVSLWEDSRHLLNKLYNSYLNLFLASYQYHSIRFSWLTYILFNKYVSSEKTLLEELLTMIATYWSVT